MDILILSIAGAIITLLLGVIGFFVRNLVNVVDKLKESVVMLDTTVKDGQMLNETVHNHHKELLDRHECRLNNIDDKIYSLELKKNKQ